MKRFAVVLCLVGCGGGAAPEAATPTSNGGGSGTSAPETSPQSVQNSTTPDHGHSSQISAARGEVDRAESQVNAAMSDCATACRALESMERAAEHLCALDSGSECGRARQRLEAARERVRASCGGCR